MSTFFDRHLVQPMMLTRDASTGRVTHIQTDPHDSVEVRKLLEAILADDWRRHSIPALDVSAPALPEAPRNIPSAVLPPLPVDASRRWMSECIAHWLEEAARKQKLDANTVRYTYAPPLRVFRELIALQRRDLANSSTCEWDIRMDEITPERMDQFVRDFWRFPDRRGRRNHADAREVLAGGGSPQSRNNALKNFSYVLAFVRWAAKRGELDSQARDRLEASLEDTTPDDRSRPHEQPLSPIDGDEDQGSGYVAWSRAELKLLFGGPAFVRYAARNPARYWIALLGLFSGLRIGEASQLRPRDFRRLDGIDCVVVTASKLDAQGQRVGPDQQRTKTFSGRRMIPLHPELVRLGLLDYAADRVASNSTWLFDLPWYPKPGFGHYPTRDFALLSKAVGVHQAKRKVHHSFRATLSQALEEGGLLDTLVDRLLGHKVRTVRAKHYSRNSDGRTVPLRLVHEAISKVDFDVRIPQWSEVRNAARGHQRRSSNGADERQSRPPKKIVQGSMIEINKLLRLSYFHQKLRLN